MDLGPLRRLALDLNFSAFGVDAVVKRPGAADNVAARLVWVTPQTQAMPTGFDLQVVGERRVAAFRKSEIARIERGTLIAAADRFAATVRAWRVEGPEHLEDEHVRVLVVRMRDLDDEAIYWRPPAS